MKRLICKAQAIEPVITKKLYDFLQAGWKISSFLKMKPTTFETSVSALEHLGGCYFTWYDKARKVKIIWLFEKSGKAYLNCPEFYFSEQINDYTNILNNLNKLLKELQQRH